MIEEYAFSFSYSNSDGQEVSMSINRTGNRKKGETFKCFSNTEITSSQMKNSACKMVRTLVQLMSTLDKMPQERTILMKLFYYDDVTPADYEPPFFKSCSEAEAHNPWTKNPLRMEVGNVNSKFFALALKVKSVLDPCEDENEDANDDDVHLGDDSAQSDDFSESDSGVNQSHEDQYIVAPVGTPQTREDSLMDDEDNTQDPVEDEQQLGRVKDWITSRRLDTVELTDVLSNFPEISVALTEEIMAKLVKNGTLSKTGRDIFNIKERKKFDYEFDAVKEEKDAHSVPICMRTPQGMPDHMYMKALYYALPMDYVTVPKLLNKLEGEANQTSVRKLIDKMVRDGFVEAQSNGRLGKRVVHSDLTEQKLAEVSKALDTGPMDVDTVAPPSKSVQQGLCLTESDQRNMSTCGVLHSIGSDVTRMKGRSSLHQNGSKRSEQTISKTGNTPTSRAEPVASRESFALDNENGGVNGNINHREDSDMLICSRPTQDKRARKASTVKEPIIQYRKRQKPQAA